ELRSPLAALKLLVQITRDEVVAGNVERILDKLPDRLERVQRQADRIDALINRLMSISIIAGGRLVLDSRPLDLSKILVDVFDDLKEVAQQARCQISVQTSGDAIGYWSPEHLEEVTRNLLHNALKFGQGKPVEVDVGGDSNNAWVSITDHGIGIADEDKE